MDNDSDGEQGNCIRPLDSTERLSLQSDQARHQHMTQLLGSEFGFTSDSGDAVLSRQDAGFTVNFSL